jgi:RNase P protein component
MQVSESKRGLEMNKNSFFPVDAPFLSQPLFALPFFDFPLFVGFTASRKVGNAVARNLAKRRLRAWGRQELRHALARNVPKIFERTPITLSKRSMHSLFDFCDKAFQLGKPLHRPFAELSESEMSQKYTALRSGAFVGVCEHSIGTTHPNLDHKTDNNEIETAERSDGQHPGLHVPSGFYESKNDSLQQPISGSWAGDTELAKQTTLQGLAVVLIANARTPNVPWALLSADLHRVIDSCCQHGGASAFTDKRLVNKWGGDGAASKLPKIKRKW